MDDRQLMRAIRGGDARGFEMLFDRHAGSVLAVAQRVLRDRAEAEEVVEEVFWEVWRNAKRYDPKRAAPVSYLLLMARSRALDRVRSRQRRQAHAVEVGDLADLDRAAGGSTDPTPFDEVDRAERGRRVRAALARLSEPQRQAIELSFYEGLSHAEIAERLGWPLGTVKTRIRGGFKLLRRILAGSPERDEVA